MNTFKNYKANAVTVSTDIVTCPANVAMTIVGMTIANVSGNTSLITIKLGSTSILQNATLLAGSAMVPIGGEQKVVLEPTDAISVQSDNPVDVIVSVLEIS